MSAALSGHYDQAVSKAQNEGHFASFADTRSYACPTNPEWHFVTHMLAGCSEVLLPKDEMICLGSFMDVGPYICVLGHIVVCVCRS